MIRIWLAFTNPRMGIAMRRFLFPVVLVTALPLVAAAQTDPDPDAERCAAVEPAGQIELGGRSLVEIPDVTDPELRRANTLLSHGCPKVVRAILEARLQNPTPDAQTLYVLARYMWILMGREAGEQIVRQTITAYPEFASARLLLAGIRIDQYRHDEAETILDDLGPGNDDRLWVFMNRLRIQAHNSPDESIRRALLEILEDETFPPNARDTAAVTLRQTRWVTPDEVIASYEIPLSYDSGLRFSCKLNNYAFTMTERMERFEQAIEKIEPLVDRDRGCSSQPGARVYLGYAYLVLASRLAARPEPVNEAYVDRANELLADGGHARLAGFLVSRPREAAVKPFLLPWLNTEETDQYGRTRLCNGVVLLNPETVQAELARGADPNGLCNGNPLALHVALIATREYVTERQTILGLLLEYGATVDDLSFCNSTDMGDCATVLYPIFRQY